MFLLTQHIEKTGGFKERFQFIILTPPSTTRINMGAGTEERGIGHIGRCEFTRSISSMEQSLTGVKLLLIS